MSKTAKVICCSVVARIVVCAKIKQNRNSLKALQMDYLTKCEARWLGICKVLD